MSTNPNRKYRVLPLRLSVIFLLLLSILLLQACSSGTKAEKTVPSVLNFGYIGSNSLNLPTGAEGWGLYKGIIQEELKKHGIETINTFGFPNGPDESEALISGRLNAGALGDTPAIISYSGGAKTRFVGQINSGLKAFVIGKKNGPTTVKELEGKVIAVPKGSYSHRYIIGLLKESGVTKYELVHMLGSDAAAAIARGDIDANVGFGADALSLLKQGYPLIHASDDTPHLAGSSVTVANEDFLRKFPDFPKVWNEAREKALADLKQHEAEYYDFMSQIVGLSVEDVKKLYPVSILTDQPISDKALTHLEGVKEFLLEEGLTKKEFNIKDWAVK
ncbi:ABC transporter substrate-binding protein [Cohnella terricola]|uniref:Nitrate ABC transporter substrate-binding protein n=1 Tax=Cohnella terricola TaxID=1289167 RepID=A0A559JWS9_9BACL|nr:ABC transporter substrate-binding protein [Cohnella terricola]TVY04287.1 nitrate ABC transporter substrate-binding protein [Cohnella terricola]